MSGENILFLVICIFVSFIMIGIGISQLRSKKPVGFYTGKQPPREDDLSDVRSWNQKHGLMWLIYGLIISVSAIAGIIIVNNVMSMILIGGGFLIPIVIMIWYHNRLTKVYKK